MTIKPFEALTRLRQRMAEAVIAQSGLRHAVLADHLRRTLASPHGDGALIPPPVIEGAFPFEVANESLQELSGRLLNSRTVDALAGDNSGEGYSFPRDRAPYRHQLAAWRVLTGTDIKSAVVTAGTGSGKTECFLVPLLDSLYRRSERSVGVEAIMLYPLNALIASQRERLDAWTKPANGEIRYCLYNGDLTDNLDSRKLRDELAKAPQVVPDRRTLREAPPPLLVTNLTMLEYMLVRPKDQPIIERSKGKLKWIVLDEAHTLIGSAAAEVALLLRRVMEAFEVDPSNVRFIATSATIGEGAAVKEELRQFLAQVGGIDGSQVEVISGDRRLPSRSSKGGAAPLPHDILNLPADKLYDRLAGHDPVWKLVEDLKSSAVTAKAIDALGQSLGVDGETLAMALTRAKSEGGDTLAPLRVHSFHRAVPGLWCCTNPDCKDTLGEGWRAGRILFDRDESCPSCDMPTAELFSCNECGAAFMMAEEIDGRLRPPRGLPPSDEFLFDAERSANEEAEDEDDAPVEPPAPSVMHCFSLSDSGLTALFVDGSSGRCYDSNEDGRYRLSHHLGGGGGPCPECSATAKSGDKLYPFRFGAPFIVGNAAPLLLASMPHSEKVTPPALPQSSPDLPSSGRQLISFTDSRQGTARMAAKLQTEGERAFVRSFIYQAVQHAGAASGESAETEKLRAEIGALKNIAGWEDGPFLGMVQEKETKLSSLTSGGATLPWTSLKGALAERVEVRDWLPHVWGERSELFSNSKTSAASQIAEALLLRELMKRPRSANSPETMGIAKIIYPAIEKITDAPGGFLQRGATLNDWKAWLTTITTFSVRNALAVSVRHEILQWIMRKGFPKNLAAPGQEPGKRQQGWPRANAGGVQSQASTLLRMGLHLNVASHADREEMNDWYNRAWHHLLPLFSQNESGERALDFDKLEIGAVTQAYHCPVTRRIVDIAPFGLSPYAHTPTNRAEPLTMPTCPANGDEETRQRFLETDETVSSLRARGLWTNMHDRIALFSPYARSAEHSAQLSPGTLREYEAEFKAGQINLLNCSTTMEMGVDIGSVNGVLMTNVPPSIANYRQRVGRAGRRGQPLSLAFTFAKDRPLDREAFSDPTLFLQRTVAAPRVALDSRPIVQRHVNAFFLSRFLALNSGDAMKMTAGHFFGCPETPRASRVPKADRPVALLTDWLSQATTVQEYKQAIARLTKGSILAGRNDLDRCCIEDISAAEEEFHKEWDALQSQLGDASAIGATEAITRHLKRQCDEFLLSDLADRGFLPGHGFPNHVVSFELDRRDGRGSGNRDGDNAYIGQRHGGPKRPLDIAIRDYAPGSETVVDGQVYRVGGVSLNWHRPASDAGARENQALRWAARCHRCGDSWTGAGAHPDDCRTCGRESPEVMDYLKPAGFLRDLREPVHAEVDRVSYIRPEQARISAGSASWETLSNTTIGRLRLNRRGTVYYHTRGAHQKGYGLCLRCGCMAPMEKDEITCSALTGHKPLRAKEGFSQPCEGNNQPFSMRAALNLGYEIHTDVLELQPAELPQLGAANAIAIATRESMARHLGIEPDEIGYGVAASRNAMTSPTLSIFLYDRAAGGGGYVARAADSMRAVLRDARKRLDCPRKCAHACSACVLVSDAPEREEELDRHAAITFMDAHLRLPATLATVDVFAAESDISDRPVREIDNWLNNHPKASLTVWAKSDDIIALSNWVLTPLFRRWSDNGRKIFVVLPKGTVASLDAAQILFLRDYCTHNGVHVAEGAAPKFENGSSLFASANDSKNGRCWASRDESILNVGVNWGEDQQYPVAQAPLRLNPSFTEIERDRLKPAAGAVVTALGYKLEGPIQYFGMVMASTIRKAAAECGVIANDLITRIEYSDRYARSPLVLKLLIDTVAKLNTAAPITLSIQTAPDRGGNSYRPNVYSDIEADETLVAIGRAYGQRLKLNVSLSV